MAMSTGATQKKVRKITDLNSGEDSSERNNNEEEIQKALEGIDSCQNEIDALNEQSSREILKIEEKFNNLLIPYYDKRNDLISKIPHFWVTTFVNHPDVSAIIDNSEEDCLHHLTKLLVHEFDDILAGYKISFFFEENPYFDNTVLTKEFCLKSLESPTSRSTPIKWKEGFDLTQNKQSPSKTGRKRSYEHKSFFMWFNDNADPLSDEIADVIKDDIWINPLQYFLVADVNVDNGVEDEDGSDEEEENEGGGDPIVIEDTDEDTREIHSADVDG